MTDLLDAVEALTKPVKRSRLVEQDHEHDWREVVTPVRGVPSTSDRKQAWIDWAVTESARIHRSITEDEAMALTKVALIETYGSPEPLPAAWTCVYCDTTTELPTHNVPKFQKRTNTDPCLLDQLEETITSGTGQGSVRAQRSEQIQLDIAAYELFEEIGDRLRAWALNQGARLKGRLSLKDLCTSWYALQLANPDHEAEHAKVLKAFAGRIREHLNPRTTGDIAGICPRCRYAYVITDDNIRKRALQTKEGATYDTTEAECLVCGQQWKGWAELNELANGIQRHAGSEELESPPLAS